MVWRRSKSLASRSRERIPILSAAFVFSAPDLQWMPLSPAEPGGRVYAESYCIGSWRNVPPGWASIFCGRLPGTVFLRMEFTWETEKGGLDGLLEPTAVTRECGAGLDSMLFEQEIAATRFGNIIAWRRGPIAWNSTGGGREKSKSPRLDK